MRSISAKSLGSLTRGLGEATFPDLRPWLVDTLRSEGGSGVERSGAAQGLSELLVAGGARLTESVMINEILPLRSHPKAGTGEGVLWVLTFLPSVLGQAYSSLIDESLPALLSGLADENESVRDVALRAGRVLVKSHGKASKDKILPSLEEGLSNEDYRIRNASLMLLGDLLGMIGGTKVGKANTDTQGENTTWDNSAQPLDHHLPSSLLFFIEIKFLLQMTSDKLSEPRPRLLFRWEMRPEKEFSAVCTLRGATQQQLSAFRQCRSGSLSLV